MLLAARLLVGLGARVFAWIPSAGFRRAYAILSAIIAGGGLCMFLIGCFLSPAVLGDILGLIWRRHEELPTTNRLVVGGILAALIGALVFVIRGALPQPGVPYKPRAAEWKLGRSAKYLGLLSLLLLVSVAIQDAELRWRLHRLEREAEQLVSELKPADVPHELNAAIDYQEAIDAAKGVVSWEDDNDFVEPDYKRSRELPDDKAAVFEQKLQPVVQAFLRASQKPRCQFPEEYRDLIQTDKPTERPHHTSVFWRIRWYTRYKAEHQQPDACLESLAAFRQYEEHFIMDPRRVDPVEFFWWERDIKDILAHVVTHYDSLDSNQLEQLIADPLHIDELFQSCLKWHAAEVRSGLAKVYTIPADQWDRPYGIDKSVGQSILGLFGTRLVSCRDDILAVQHAYSIEQNHVDAAKHKVALVDDDLCRGRFLPRLDGCFSSSWLWKAECHRRLANIAIAAKLYEQTNGQWPDSLNALSPEWLPEVPTVPGSDEVFLSRRIDGGMMVYHSQDAEYFDAYEDSAEWWSNSENLLTLSEVLYLGQAYIRAHEAVEKQYSGSYGDIDEE